MELKYVGAKPIVSQHGISFDQNKSDKYTFINSAIELMEALIEQHKDNEVVELLNFEYQELNGKQMLEKLKLYCDDIDEIFNSREAQAKELISKYIDSVENNNNLTNDEKTAWIGNINVMSDYYLQYITNENAYNSILNALADEIVKRKIKEIIFPVGRNYGLVLGDLASVLTDHKPPVDTKMSFEDRDGQAVGRLTLR